MDRSEVIGNGKGILDEKGLEEKVLEEVAMATCQSHSTPMLPVYYSAPSQGQLVQLAVLTR